MEVLLSALPPTTRGIYTVRGQPGRLPARFLYLHPGARDDFLALEQETGGLIYTDILRSAIESLHAVQTKMGVQPPSYSAHNYGLAVDFDIEGSEKRAGKSYSELLEAAAKHGWFCHRRDGKRGDSESWHLNWLGREPEKYLAKTINGPWSLAAEHRILDLYGAQLQLDDLEVQSALKSLKLYSGALDGVFGPLTRQALRAFQRTWTLPETGEASSWTRRTLAFVTAKFTIV